MNPRKPTKLKLIEGTFRPDRAPKREIVPPVTLSADPPRGLDVYARRAWRQQAPILRRLGLLTDADAPAFLALCQASSRYERANVRLRRLNRKRGAGIEEIRRYEVSVERAEHSLRQLWAEFGMTPAARSRLDVYAPPPETETDEYERMFGAGSGSGKTS